MATNTSLLDGIEYSDIATWEADKDGTSAATDTERLEITIVGSEPGALAIAGWANKTGGNSIQIEWLGDAFHAGLLNRTSSNAYVIESINCNEASPTVLTGAFLDRAIGSVAGSTAGYIVGSSNDGAETKFVNCIGEGNAKANADMFVSFGGSSSDVYCLNCIAMNGEAASDAFGFRLAGSGTSETYNCIAYKFGRGFELNSHFNGWSLDSGDNDVSDTTVSYCLFNTETGTITKVIGNNDVALLIDTGTEADNTINVADLTAAAEDLTPEEFSTTVTYSNIAIEAGNDYSGTFSELANDITGQARGANPTIGAYEVVSAGPSGASLLLMQQSFRQ